MLSDAVTAPRTPPPGACDAHTHLFGPLEDYPLSHPSSYPLPEATPERHAAMRRAVGVERAVAVQPAPYGEDPSLILDAIAGAGGALRGVAVAGPDIADETLAAWRSGGIVGLRFVEARTPAGTPYPGSVGFSALEAMAPRMAALGLHAQLWAPAAVLVDWAERLSGLGLVLVLDHMGAPQTGLGVDDATFRRLVDFVADSETWVKLTTCRLMPGQPDHPDIRPFHEALLRAAPERLVWGSDWPYVRLDPAPDAGRQFDLFCDWTTDAALMRRILVDNPAHLYGF